MADIRTQSNRLRNWNGTVHYATDGVPACGPILTHKGWLAQSVATVTCKRCISIFGADEPGHVDPEPRPDENIARRAAERSARRSVVA